MTSDEWVATIALLAAILAATVALVGFVSRYG